MSKRNAILIILLATIFIIGGLFYFYFHILGNGNAQIQNPLVSSTVTNPFGNNGTTVTNTTATSTSGNQTVITNTAKLIEIYKNPTSGSVFFTNAEGQDDLRFVDRGNGNVYEYIPASQTGQPTRLTNTTVPKIQQAIWSGTGNNVFLRYLDNAENIISFAAAVNVATTSGVLGNVSGSFVAQNISQLAINPDGDKAFGLLEESGGGSYGVTFNIDGSKEKQIFSSPVSDWNVSWPNTDILTFTTKPTYEDYGFLYFFNTQTQTMEKILGDIPGLSTLTNSDASLVAYSQSENSSFSLDIYNVKNKASEGYTITTLADKCVWGNTDNTVLYCAVPQIIPLDNYPDAWYQGTESFSDSIWMIDTTTGTTQLIYQIGKNENASIDAMNLEISPDDQYLAFTNKDDLSLWVLQLNQ